MPRLFIALPLNLDSSQKRTIEPVYSYLNKHNKELKVISPENYHITLKFLGECSDKVAKRVEDDFEQITKLNKIVSFSLSGMGVFPDLKDISVLWAGIRTDETLINKLNQNIEDFAYNFGFKKEKRKFLPHLTLARVRKGKKININLRQYIVENKESFFFQSAFTRIVLFSSNLTQEGPEYTEIKSLEFKTETDDLYDL